MSDYLYWLGVAILAVPALTIIFATYKSAHRLRADRVLTNMAELSAFFTIPVFYGFAAIIGFSVAILAGDNAAIGFITGFVTVLVVGETWLLMRLRIFV